MADTLMNTLDTSQAPLTSNSNGAIPLNPTHTLPQRGPTQSERKQSKARSNSEVDELESSSSESDLSDVESESHQLLANRSTVTQQGQGQGGATSQGGAIAGPGPSSSSSLKRSLPPSSRASSAQPLPQTQPPTKKKRGRQSVINTNSDAYLVPVPLPHYTVHKVPENQNSKTKRHVIKINADVTDGSQTRWPTQAEFDPTHKASKRPGDPPTTNWYEKVARTEGKHKYMLERVGDELAKKLGLNKKTKDDDDPEYWILDSFPTDYLFTTHHSTNRSTQPRTDPYVFGTRITTKFRSANEIIPHIYWLLCHGPDDKLRCQCQYCTLKSQTDVNKSEGLDAYTGSRTPGPGGPSSLSTGRKKAGRTSNLGPQDRKPSIDKKPLSTNPQKPNSRNPTPTIPSNSTSTTNQPVRSRTFNSTSPEPSYSGSFIDKQRDSDLSSGAFFRTGEMVWAAIPQGSLASSQDPQNWSIEITHWPAIIQSRSERTLPRLSQPYISGQDSSPKFLNDKRWVYRVIYLGSLNSADGLEEDELKSWLAGSPPENVWQKERLLNVESVERIWDGNRINKCQLGSLKDLEGAVAPLAFAMQIAAHLMTSFSLTDRFTIKDNHFVTASFDDDPLSSESLDAMQRSKNNWFYQSLYLGSELIWVNEFVRVVYLKDQGLPPQHDLSSESSADRSLFMHVQQIWKDQETRVAKLTGQIYELRDLRENTRGAGIGSIGGGMSMFQKKKSGSSGGLASKGGGVTKPEPSSTSPPDSPPSTFFPDHLPPAPEGFEFNRLTPGESQVTIELDYLAGRYYPLPKHLDQRHKIDEMLREFPLGPVYDEDGGAEKVKEQMLTEDHRAIALAGLTPAVRLYCKVGKWQGDRLAALVNAEDNACKEVAEFFQDNYEQD